MKLIWKSIISFISICIILLISFFAIIIFALIREAQFYAPLIIIMDLLIIAFFILWLIGKKELSKIMIGILILIAVCIITGAGYRLNKYYISKIPTVNEQGVDLFDYQPFNDKSKVKKLIEKSTLQLQDDLPRIDGATALYPLYSSFVQAVYPEKKYDPNNSEVICSATPNAYQNLIDGKVDVIFCAKPSDDQIKKAKDKGLTFNLTPIGKEAFVFFVNKKNRISGLTRDQIKGIYSGEITNWKQVGGNNVKIIAYQRPENSGSQTMLQKIMEGKKIMEPIKDESEVLIGMGEIIEKTASYKNFGNAIGYSFLFFATEMVKNNKIKLLKIEGINPSRETIKNSQYPFSAYIYAVTCSKNNKNVDLLIKWILSEQGQYLVEKVGYTPIN